MYLTYDTILIKNDYPSICYDVISTYQKKLTYQKKIKFCDF